MDYDDNEFSIHNVELAEEGSSTVSPVLRPYDYEDGGNLRFDSLVENEVFLGITGQEDNQWIEEYSRGTSSSAVESRRDNVWSEATSSESVEMLLKSCGQGALVTESSDEPGSLATNMNPNLKQDFENSHAQEAMVTNREEEWALATEESDVIDEPGSLVTDMDPNLERDENSHAEEATVPNKEEEANLATEELDASDVPASLSMYMDPNLKQDDEHNQSQEAMVTDKVEDGALATEELDVIDEPFSLSINMDPSFKQEDENDHAHEAMVTDKEEEGALATAEFDVNDEPGSIFTNMDFSLMQDVENNDAQEAMVANKEEEGVLATEEFDVSEEPGSFSHHQAMVRNKEEEWALGTVELDVIDEPGSLTTNMDPTLEQDDDNNHAQEEMVTNKEEEGVLETEELDASDEPGSLSINMDPTLEQDENNHAQEVLVTNKEEERVLASEELDLSDEPGSLSTNIDSYLMQADENIHAQEAMVTNKVKVLVTEELEESDEPGCLFMNMDPDLKHDDENNDTQEAVVTNKEEEGVLGTDKLDASDEPGSLSINMDPNLRQDDENNHSQEAMVTSKEEVGALETEELDVIDGPGSLSINTDPDLKQNDGNHHAQEAMVTNKEEEWALESEELDVIDEPGSFSINMESNLEQDESNHAQEAMVRNKEEPGSLAPEELDVSDEPDSLCSNMDLNLEQNNDNNHAEEAMVMNKEEEGALATVELDASDEPGGLFIKMDPNLMQDAENNHAQEAMVTYKEEGASATEELDVRNEPGSLSTYMDPNSMQDDENDHAHDTMVTNKEEEGTLATEELDASDEPSSLSINMDPNLKQADEDYHAQEAMVINQEEERALATDELDVSDESGSLAINMDPSLKQDDGNNHAQEPKVTNKEVAPLVHEELNTSDDPGNLTTNMDLNLEQDVGKNYAHEAMKINNLTIAKDSHEEAKVSGGELDSDVLGKKCDSSVEKVDGICEDVNHDARNIVVELSENELQEDLSTSEIECANLDASEECDLKICPSSNKGESSSKNTDNPIGGHTAVDILVDEESMPAGSCNLLMTAACAEATAFPEAHELNNDLMLEDLPPVAVEDDGKTNIENLASLEFNVCSPSKVSNVQSRYVEESEKADSVFDSSKTGEGSSINAMGTNMTNTCSSAELPAGNTDLVATPKAHSENLIDKDHSPAATLSGSVQQEVIDELQSSEQDGGTCIDHDVTLHEEGNARLPLDTDIAAFDSQKNVESISSAEGCNTQGFEADFTSLAASGYIDAKSPPILGGTSSVHHDNEEKKEERVISEGTCENESLKVAGGMVDCASLSVVETGASPDGAGEPVHGMFVGNMNVIVDELAQEANPGGLGGCSTLLIVDPIPSDSSAKVGDSVKAGGGIQDFISGHHANMSSEQHASTGVVLTSECDDSHTRREEETSCFMDKLQSVSPLDTNNNELSQSTRVKSIEDAINENASLPEATEDVVPTSECDDSQMRHGEDSSASVDKLHSEPSQTTRVKPSEATEDVQGKVQSVSSNSDVQIDKSFTFEVSAAAELSETGKGLQLFPVSQACSLSKNMQPPCIDSSSSTLDTRKPNEAPIVTPQKPGSGTIHAGGKERKTRPKSVGKQSVKKGEKSSPLLVTPPLPTAAAAGHVIQFQELRPEEKVEGSLTKPVPISNLPDLNNATSIFHQPFTNNQQVQLRAQILVYGSLISGTPPEETHMTAAFGQSDAGRKTWEAAWHACMERVDGQKSQANTPRSDLKDLGYRTPDLGVKHSSNKGTPPAVSPLIHAPSPLWNMSTPSCVGFQSRTPAFQHLFTPVHPHTYQTPPNPLWLSPGPFIGQWGVAPSPASSAPRFPASPITEAVKLTPVNVSSDSKSRKRKKVTAAVSSVPSQVLMTPAHLVSRSGGHNNSQIPFLVENQTDSVTAPVTSIFSTSVTVSTPPGRFLSVHEEGNDSRSIKRTKVTTSPAVSLTLVSTPVPSTVTHLPQVIDSEISLLAQNHTISATAPAFCTSFPTSAVMSTPASTHGYPRTRYQNTENALAVVETLSKVKESKIQAENAALLAAAEVGHCQDVWSGLDSQKNSVVFSDAEAKLVASIAAAATVAKMASAAAKIASNVAEQAKLMADEVILSSKTESSDHSSHPNAVNKATPASNSIISAAREAARRRIEAASAASKHAENLDAIVKAAELAAEAVSQVGKIVAVHDSSTLRKLAEVGPEGFWKVSPLAYEQRLGGGLHLNSNVGKKNTPDVFIEEIKTSKHDRGPPVNLAQNQMVIVLDAGNEKDTRTSKVPNLSKASGISSEINAGSPHTYVVGHCVPQNIPGIWEEHNIKEGCFVEVYRKDGKYKGAWLAANILSLKDEKALVCYTEIQSSDDGSEEAKEWVAFGVEGSEEVPRIRIAHPLTTMRFERKRRRTAITDYAWSKGDRVDAWMQDCWREGVVTEPNTTDVTSLTVQFQVQGETSVVRSWHVRPTLIWKDRKWIEWKGGRASQSESPKEKRMKLGSPDAVIDKRKDKLPTNVDPGRHEEQESLFPLLSTQVSCFNVGKSTNKPSTNLRPVQKERARVVFGVPKPGGKKQKFMDVSTQCVDDRSNKTNTTNGSFRFTKPPVNRGSRNDATENQVTETKSKLKSRKPPVPSFRTVSRDSEPTDVGSVENSSSRQNHTQAGSSSNKLGPTSKKGFTFTSKPKSEHFNRGKLQLAPKIEVKDSSNSQVNEPRRSNRTIQPTSRLLEGLQSSLTVSKIPSVSHAVQRKVTPKGNTNHG